MNLLIPFTDLSREAVKSFGGKAMMLARLQQEGFMVPAGYCLPVSVYHDFLVETGLDTFIAMELQRKDFRAMRWEELWDVSLRIRNHFLSRAWPKAMKEKLLKDLSEGPANWSAVAVRSTAPGEDSASQSFAGLHESRVMLQGAEAILEAIRIVWASLWSDGALLYRHELGLDSGKSGMAVILQEMVVGEVSGILFTRAPQDGSVMMAEAVWGLNQALVDGSIEPDRWQFNRATGAVTEKHEVVHTVALRPTTHGTELSSLGEAQRGQSPFDPVLCRELFQAGCQLEASLGLALDIEWTYSDKNLHILQARPITTSLQTEEGDERPWYLSLHRSLNNLEALRMELEQQVLPGMDHDAEKMSAVELSHLSNRTLAGEYLHRRRILDKWLSVYKEKCIPMAHGLRLFGEFYNDLLKPEDPHEFINLLHSDDLLAVKRNQQLREMAELLRNDHRLLQELKDGRGLPDGSRLKLMLEAFNREYSGINWVLPKELDLSSWLVKLAEQDSDDKSEGLKQADREQAFFDQVPETERGMAVRILAVAKASYLLRDNDNLYLGKVRAGVSAAEQEIRERIGSGVSEGLDKILPETTEKKVFSRYESQREPVESPDTWQLARQLVGQPAGPGVNSGPARVLDNASVLTDFKAGEVLVCDAIEPNMTFLAPLAAAIIERRGGMLVHGAIIAREYGIPCVTGIPEATKVIKSGDQLTVDGYLGIVTIDRGKG
ncbi:MAG: PEP-utilizing enzyme [Desulfuromonadales bacterium]|jgi:pyruvate,water dikinase|nr:PEP-utilizing enzyme [Desulfuromonadales bacterium]MDH3807067.1 PEP-utilizing enzyme [Desulfuromonadales bacterium]MDH3867795.1 PEP-utilizing enzyme [Desulfuromonadales bacterium]MDH3959733.1 PEP-utilizing enzyme [Desulfuromonadales bacterium]